MAGSAAVIAIEPASTLEHGLEAARIQQIDIRRKGAGAVVHVAIRGAARTRNYAFESYQAGLRFCAALWEQRRHSLGLADFGLPDLGRPPRANRR